MKRLISNLALSLVSVLLFVAVFEVVLRFLPVGDALLAEPVSEDQPIFRFRPDRTLMWSRGATFDLVNRIRVNNAGFVNDQDYRSDDETPLLAVVGDSQIEAAMVPYEDTLHGRLASARADRVYSFAASGAPLSQYVVWARYARQAWKAERLVVVVIGNDFDESLASVKQGPGFHHYKEDESGELGLVRFDYRPNPLRPLVKHSAVARYLLFNIQIIQRVERLLSAFSIEARAESERYAGNTSVSADPPRVALSKRAVSAFFRDLIDTAGWHPKTVLFVVDGFRYPDRAVAGAGSYFGVMRTHFITEANALGFGVIDMDPIFFADFTGSGQPFEFPTDGHWNGRAHGLAARAVSQVIDAGW
ncbi:MAG: hypothetical protein AAGF59_15415 [Pseudomonadota bacterium]